MCPIMIKYWRHVFNQSLAFYVVRTIGVGEAQQTASLSPTHILNPLRNYMQLGEQNITFITDKAHIGECVCGQASFLISNSRWGILIHESWEKLEITKSLYECELPTGCMEPKNEETRMELHVPSFYSQI